MGIISGDGEREAGARTFTAAAHRSSTAAPAAVIGDRRQAHEFGDGLIGKVSISDNSASGVRGALDRTEDLIETGPQRIVVD